MKLKLEARRYDCSVKSKLYILLGRGIHRLFLAGTLYFEKHFNGNIIMVNIVTMEAEISCFTYNAHAR